MKSTINYPVVRASWVPLALALLISSAAWAILFVTVPPSKQNFPLIDDWAFSKGALLFARGEGIHYGDWASMPQLGQWAWACAFLWLLGDSFVVLRLSTIILSWLGLIAFYDLLRQEGFLPRSAGFATFVLALNPLFFLLQGTFMTDVPALAFALIALALYGRAFLGGRRDVLAAATAVAILGAVTRQNAIAVPIAAAVLLVRLPALRHRFAWWLAVALPFLISIVTDLWFRRHGDVLSTRPELPSPTNVLVVSFAALHFCGLSALPLLALRPRRSSWAAFAVALAFMAGGAIYCWARGNLLLWGGFFPYLDGVLTPHGAYSAATVVGRRLLLVPGDVRIVLSVLGCLAGAGLVARSYHRATACGRLGPLVLFTLVQAMLLLIAPMLYDRYLLVLLPGAFYLAGSAVVEARWSWLLAAAGALALGIVSLGLMHDWLSWNSARWELGRRAVARGIHPWEIEGGFEWDGWHAPLREADRAPAQHTGFRLPMTAGYFHHVSGRFALSFSELNGTITRDSEPYQQWLPYGRRQFFLLEIEHTTN